MAKNPFELRFNTLELARQHLMERFYAQLETYKENIQRGVPSKNNPPAVYPTPEDVMALATKFKTFVDNGDLTV